MRYIIACDSFKGSLSSQEANDLIAQTVQATSTYQPEIYMYQLSDGGEGFLKSVMHYYPNGQLYNIIVDNPLGQRVNAQYYCVDKTAYIESAEAIGIEKVYTQLDIEKATSFGLGEMIQDAYQKGMRDFVIGLGGSATSDMGLGVLQALGCLLKDEQGNILHEKQNNQFYTYKILKSRLVEQLQSCTFTIISDVEGTLLGSNGAAMMFAKQKGANAEQQAQLEKSALKIVALYNEIGGNDKTNTRATAAAGGLGYFFQSLFHAQNKMGSDWFIECSGIEKTMTKGAILITGEGSIDRQTLQGKGPGRIAEYARKKGLFTVGVGGRVDLIEQQSTVFDALFSIQSEPRPLVEALDEAITRKQLVFTIRQLILLIERE